VKLLNEAKLKITSLDFYKDSPTDESSALATTTPNLPLPLKLIRDFFLMSKHQEAIKLLQNFQIAAMHLACMFRGAANTDDQLVSFISIICSHLDTISLINNVLIDLFRPYRIYLMSLINGKHISLSLYLYVN